jgi:uridine kinase
MRPGLTWELARRIARVKRPHPLRVAIDGVDAAGKTTLADELVEPLTHLGRPVIRASIDGFHNPRAIRYARGESSGEGYFRDSFDHTALMAVLLRPLGPDGDRRYRRGVFDFRTDSPIDAPVQDAASDAVLLFDGVFLLIPDLRPYWDFSIFVRASFETTIARAELRDQQLFGTAAQVRQRYEERYIPGQRLYLAETQPQRHATLVVDNNDLNRPKLIDVGAIEIAERPEELRAYVQHYLALLPTADTENAWHSLVEIGPAAMPYLVDCFARTTAVEVKATLVRVASEYRSFEALPLLGAALRSKNAEIWKAGLDGLVTLGGEQAIETIRKARPDASPEQREWFDEALSQLNSP